MNFLKRLHIRYQLLFLAFSTVIITFCLYIITYFQVSNVIAGNNREYAVSMFTQMKQAISSDSNLLERILTGIAYNDAVQKYMFEVDEYTRYQNSKTMDNLFYNMQEIQNGILDIAILSNEGNDYFLRGSNDKIRGIIEKLPVNFRYFYTKKEEVVYQNQKMDCFVLATPIYSVIQGKQQGQVIGVAAIVFNTKVLGLGVDKNFESADTKFYLLDRNNTVYSSNDPSSLDKRLDVFVSQNSGQKENIMQIGGREMVVNIDDIPEIGGKILSVVPKDKLFANVLWMRKLAIIVFLIAMIILLIPFLIVSRNIIDPLKKLMNFMASIKKGNLDSLKRRIELKGYVEIEKMAEEFNNLLDEISELTNGLIDVNSKLYEAELAKKRSELAYLKSQINPHFLYNTLETMKGSAIDEEAPKTMEIAKALGQIFRYSVKGGDMVPLSEELEIIKSYVQIQQVRFNDRIQVHYEFDQDVLNVRIPKMIIQPIAENAVFHGLETKIGKGNLWIGGKIEGNILNIWVKDDGAGMDIETLNEIRSDMSGIFREQDIKPGNNEHMGLINVNNRIKLAFGEEYGVQIASSLWVGTEVIIKVPSEGGM